MQQQIKYAWKFLLIQQKFFQISKIFLNQIKPLVLKQVSHFIILTFGKISLEPKIMNSGNPLNAAIPLNIILIYWIEWTSKD